MIAIASEPSSCWPDAAGPVATRRIATQPGGTARFAAAPADRTGSLRSIGDIVGELLAGYDLADTDIHSAVAPQPELALVD